MSGSEKSEKKKKNGKIQVEALCLGSENPNFFLFFFA